MFYTIIMLFFYLKLKKNLIFISVNKYKIIIKTIIDKMNIDTNKK